jgi:hypothetical protein
VLERIPQITGSDYKYNPNLKPTRWLLTSDFIADDIETGTGGLSGAIMISKAAFTYAAPFVAEINGVRGLYFSKRLHHALVRHVTNNGIDQEAVAKILWERFGLTIDRVGNALDYTQFTSEPRNRFQSWFMHPEELLQIINMFEELPEGFHKIAGFRWLVRRLDGTVNPVYPAAPVVSWTSGCMEFMEMSFKNVDQSSISRLILHEKAHYLYQFLLSKNFKKTWAELGGWQFSQNPSDPDYDALGGWQTTKTAEFVSAYSHDVNPNEDFAESVAYFVNDPDKLKARSITKYEFIRDNVMLSNSYVSVIRPDLTFAVLNLFPNYKYPGKVKRISTLVTGGPNEDKSLKVEIEITPFSKASNPASSIRARILSSVTPEAPAGVFFDMYFYPANTENTVFQGTMVLSKYVRKGYWQMPNLTIIDTAGRERYESSILYGWQCYINNPLEDILTPRVQPGTSTITLSSGMLSGHPVQIATLKFNVIENTGLDYYLARLVTPGAYSMDEYGVNKTDGNGIRTIDFYLKEYSRSGRYTINQIMLEDYGLNVNYTYFNTSSGNADGTTSVIDEPAPYIDFVTPNPDLIGPELDVNRITVTAVPMNFTSPDGETLVTIKYFVRDNVSGYGKGSSMKLRDPQGTEHFYWLYHRNTYSDFFEGEPSVWEQYTQEIILPRGSVPGIWGLLQMTLGDKAGNLKSYDFTETIRFDPNSTAAADLKIIVEPAAKSFYSGETIVLTITAAGGDKVSYEWFKDGVLLLPGRLDAMTGKLEIQNATQVDAGLYYCVASNSSGRVVSKTVELTFEGDYNYTKPSILFERRATSITVVWPNGFKLQSSQSLPATNWQDVAGSETTNSWSIRIDAGNQFYRLRQ